MVSLVAVFLALGLGVLFGASFIDQNVVKALQSSQTKLGDRNERLRLNVVRLEKDKEALNEFVKRSRDPLVNGALAGRNVVVLSFESTSNGVFDAVTEVLRMSQAG